MWKKTAQKMEEVSDRFIILKAVDTGETNKRLSLFCKNIGRIIAIGRGTRSKNAKLKFLNLPFCVCDGVFFKTGANTYLVKTARVLHSFSCLTQGPNKFQAGSIILEALLKFYNLPNEVFDSAISALEYIEASDENEQLFALKFLVDLVYTNFNLNLSCCNACGTVIADSENEAPKKVFLNFGTGELRCSSCTEINFRQIKQSTCQFVETVKKLEFSKLAQINCENATIKSVLKFVAELIKGLTDIDFTSIKKL